MPVLALKGRSAAVLCVPTQFCVKRATSALRGCAASTGTHRSVFQRPHPIRLRRTTFPTGWGRHSVSQAVAVLSFVCFLPDSRVIRRSTLAETLEITISSTMIATMPATMSQRGLSMPPFQPVKL